MSTCCTPARATVHRKRGRVASSLVSVAVAIAAVTPLAAARILPFLADYVSSEEAGSEAATQPCC